MICSALKTPRPNSLQWVRRKLQSVSLLSLAAQERFALLVLSQLWNNRKHDCCLFSLWLKLGGHHVHLPHALVAKPRNHKHIRTFSRIDLGNQPKITRLVSIYTKSGGDPKQSQDARIRGERLSARKLRAPQTCQGTTETRPFASWPPEQMEDTSSSEIDFQKKKHPTCVGAKKQRLLISAKWKQMKKMLFGVLSPHGPGHKCSLGSQKCVNLFGGLRTTESDVQLVFGNPKRGVSFSSDLGYLAGWVEWEMLTRAQTACKPEKMFTFGLSPQTKRQQPHSSPFQTPASKGRVASFPLGRSDYFSSWLTLEGQQKYLSFSSSVVGFQALDRTKQTCKTCFPTTTCLVLPLPAGPGVLVVVDVPRLPQGHLRHRGELFVLTASSKRRRRPTQPRRSAFAAAVWVSSFLSKGVSRV